MSPLQTWEVPLPFRHGTLLDKPRPLSRHGKSLDSDLPASDIFPGFPSGGHYWGPNQTCSLQDPPPTSADI